MITDNTPCKGLGTLRFIGNGVYANHHEFRYLETKNRYRDPRNAQYETPIKFLRYYCIFCGEILEKEDS